MPLNLPPTVNNGTTAPEAREVDPESEPDFKPDYLYEDRQTILDELRSGKRIFGVPAASLSWGIDGDRMKASLTPGIEGEKQTAAILAELAEQVPEMFVFHSLSWPESNGDTDHIVVYGNTVIVIDSKRWKSTRKYSITAKGEIMRGTVHFTEGKVKIGYALKSWRKKLPPELKVMGVVSLAQEKVFVARDKNWFKAPYRLVEAEKLSAHLLSTFKKNPIKDPVKGSTLVYLAKLLVKPRDRRAEIINLDGARRF
jgi:hypothetical protein